MDTKNVIELILHNRSHGKRHNLVVVAEGIGGSDALAKEIERVLGIEARATVLGHLQRGGTPTAIDRMHASMMGYMAVKAIYEGHVNKAVVYKKGVHKLIDLEEAVNAKREFSQEMIEVTRMLAI